MQSKTNIVLVHGAWADGSSWGKVIPFLQQKGFNVTAAQIPLTSLADFFPARWMAMPMHNRFTLLTSPFPGAERGTSSL